MKIVDAATFTAARSDLGPETLEAIPLERERHWIAASSPYPGQIHRLIHAPHGRVLARVAVLLPADGGEANFCYYARRRDLSRAQRAEFFAAFAQWLRAAGIDRLQGPIEFSTWQPYRVVSERGPSPWFPGEQAMPDSCYTDLLEAGFAVCARFSSTLVEDLEHSIAVARGFGVGRENIDFDTRTIDGADVLELLPTLYDASLSIFRDNYAYTPIARPEFEALFAGVAQLDAAVILAEDREGLLGFSFSYAIGPYAADGETPLPCAVLKTLGVHPRARRRRVGFGLGYLTHQHWLDAGCTQLIHAMMKTTNHSSAMSAPLTRALRSYALLRWEAAP